MFAIECSKVKRSFAIFTSVKYFIFIFFIGFTSIAQIDKKFKDIDSLTKALIDSIPKSEFCTYSNLSIFDRFCIDYIDLKLNAVLKDNSKFKRYSFYQKGQISPIYPLPYFSKGTKLYLYEKELSITDTCQLMNGVFNLKDKNGLIFEEILYYNGFIVKHVIKHKKSVFKQNEYFTAEIAQYDYSVYPFIMYYIKFNKNGKVLKNIIAKYNGTNWYSENHQ